MSPEERLVRVARLANTLPWKVICVGGATTPLHLTDRSAPPVTPTKDVDLLVNIDSPVEFSVTLRDFLRTAGAREDTSEDAPLCRWKLGDVIIDVVSPNPAILGFSNRWYPLALERSEARVFDDSTLHVIDAVTFLATKVEAFFGRGRGDFLGSKDIEDVIAVLDGRPELVREFPKREATIVDFLSSHFRDWLGSSDFRYAVEGYLQTDAERAPLVFERLRALVDSR